MTGKIKNIIAYIKTNIHYIIFLIFVVALFVTWILFL